MEKILVIDIETANMVEDAIAYDVGFAVADKSGKIYASYSYMIADMFFRHKDLMETAYYVEKLPQYWEDCKDHYRRLATFATVKKKVRQIMREWGITEVWAYNCYFDKNGLNRTDRYLSKSKYRYFFPKGTTFHCIWHIACQTILQQPTFFKLISANPHWISESGNIKTSAEVAYQYLTGDTEFSESHTGLEDVRIETAILAKCYQQHKKMDTAIKRDCWRLPNKAYKEWVKAR